MKKNFLLQNSGKFDLYIRILLFVLLILQGDISEAQFQSASIPENQGGGQLQLSFCGE